MICTKCKNTKNIDDFYIGRKQCKSCCIKSSLSWKKKNPEKNRELARNWAKDNKDKATLLNVIQVGKWRGKFPERYKAHSKLNNSIRDKKISKGKCRDCGSKNVHAHHSDYSKPLDVIWLCPLHHKKIHSN